MPWDTRAPGGVTPWDHRPVAVRTARQWQQANATAPSAASRFMAVASVK
jgi:hypothetical protein